MGTVDLHLHSSRSDGEYTPAEVIRMAGAAGVSIASVTDHDTIAGQQEAIEAAAAEGIGYITGIEISTQAKREQHILGYMFDCRHPAIVEVSEELGKLRRERIEEALRYLRGRGIDLDMDEVSAASHDGYVGRPHLAKAMVKAGYVSDIDEAFRKHLAHKEYYRLEMPKLTAGDAISVIAGSGGAAVLAHPHSLKMQGEELYLAVSALKELGLAGIECYYSGYGEAEIQSYIELAGRLGLAVTGGSDYHGPAVKPGVRIGRGLDGGPVFEDMGIEGKLAERRRGKARQT